MYRGGQFCQEFPARKSANVHRARSALGLKSELGDGRSCSLPCARIGTGGICTKGVFFGSEILSFTRARMKLDKCWFRAAEVSLFSKISVRRACG